MTYIYIYWLFPFLTWEYQQDITIKFRINGQVLPAEYPCTYTYNHDKRAGNMYTAFPSFVHILSEAQ